jgi:hypothetical protein
MRLEDLPVLLGVIVAVAGAVVVADAWTPDAADEPALERRRRERPERHRVGEGIFGGGLILIALALMGGDGWAYTTLAIGIAIVLVVVGTALNLRYFRGLAFGPVLGRTLGRRASDGTREAQGLGTRDSGIGE